VKLEVILDDETAQRLDAVARATGTPHSEVVRDAVSAWSRRSSHVWPAIVLEYEGDPTIPAFESWRSELAG
jgi:hypothetical protein